MKKLIIATVAIALFIGVSSVFAQVPVTGLTGKGLKAGLNMAKFTGSDVEDQKMYLGFSVGGYITYAFTDLFAVQPEVLFTMKGTKEDYTDPISGSTESLKTKLNYIEIPVLAKVQLSGGGNFKPNFYAGPEIGILLSAKAEDVDIKDQLKSTDFGLIGGVGADYFLGTGPGKITLDIRYDIGLSSIDDSGNDLKVKNSAITFLVGYGF